MSARKFKQAKTKNAEASLVYFSESNNFPGNVPIEKNLSVIQRFKQYN